MENQESSILKRVEDFQVVGIMHDPQDVAEWIDDGGGDISMATIDGRFELFCAHGE